ncbi:DNA internalization-related competence protein ComEC/Rec2 [Aestuariibacter salexigens]|uniref:DNA internalization-related competence protein ComEC/Rec2 n=1 Tax=Aestuariibacter salexigens TaxID=226010 RepID=UPI000401169A|nr:DNA internalization-related competence protein ComEC/Rec2 [Aestuariibacter salexigens]
MLTTIDQWMVGFVIGSVSALTWPHLPAIPVLAIALIVALASALSVLRFPCQASVSGLLLGVIWIASVGHWQYHLQRSVVNLRQPVVVTGQVTSVVDNRAPVTFDIATSSVSEPLFNNMRIRLRWYHPQWRVKQGQTVRLEVKLKPPHGLSNLHAFNYQSWLLSKGITATGYVKDSVYNRVESHSPTIRQALLDMLAQQSLSHKDLIAALGIGYRGWLDGEDMALIQHMGVSHLIAISGLHLTMVALLSYWLFVALCGMWQARVGRTQHNLIDNSALFVLLCCAGYAYLSGFAIPVTRAWLGIAIAFGIVRYRKHWRAPRLLLILMCSMLIVAPLALLSISLWLSLSAVFIILWSLWRWPQSQGDGVLQRWRPLIRLQIILSVMLLPIVAWQFQLVSVAGIIVNLIAVPLFTFVMLPFTLLSLSVLSVSPDHAEPLLTALNWTFAQFMHGLRLIDVLPFSALSIPSILLSAWLFALLALVLLTLPIKITRWTWLLFTPLLTVLLSPRAPHWQINVMDVGQGLAVVVQQDKRALVYDVGARYPSGFNMADAALLPYLRGQGIEHLDFVFISHADNDHAGSVDTLLSQMTAKQLLTSAKGCQQGKVWQWQQLQIEALWPPEGFEGSENDGSCVIRISDGYRSILLPGDIESSSEKQLISHYGKGLKSDILLAPHHGSNTSSTKAFLEWVQPHHVIFSQGYANRWGFPRQRVVARYEALDVQHYRTSLLGQIRITVPYKTTTPLAVQSYRQDLVPFWYVNVAQ